MKTIVAIILLAFSASYAGWTLEVLYPNREEKVFRIREDGQRIELNSKRFFCFVEPLSKTAQELTCVYEFDPKQSITNSVGTIATKTKAGLLKIQEWDNNAKDDDEAVMHLLTLYWE